MPIVAGEQISKGWKRESVEDAINRLHTNSEGGDIKKIMTIEVAIDYRRSIFTGDQSLTEENIPLPNSLVGKDHILNHPQNVVGVSPAIPTLIQRLNNGSPSILASLGLKSASRCGTAILELRDIGLNGLDRALVLGAILDEGYEGWRKSGPFIDACLGLDKTEIVGFLTKVYGENYFLVAPIGAGTNIEVSKNLPNGWTSELTRRMLALQAMFYRTGEQREVGFRTMVKQTTPIGWYGDIGPVKFSSIDEQVSAIQGIEVASAGCIFGFDEDVDISFDNTAIKRGNLLIMAKPNSSIDQNRLFQVVADFDSNPPYGLRALQFLASDKPPFSTNLRVLRKIVKFSADSECMTKILNMH